MHVEDSVLAVVSEEVDQVKCKTRKMVKTRTRSNVQVYTTFVQFKIPQLKHMLLLLLPVGSFRVHLDSWPYAWVCTCLPSALALYPHELVSRPSLFHILQPQVSNNICIQANTFREIDISSLNIQNHQDGRSQSHSPLHAIARHSKETWSR